MFGGHEGRGSGGRGQGPCGPRFCRPGPFGPGLSRPGLYGPDLSRPGRSAALPAMILLAGLILAAVPQVVLGQGAGDLAASCESAAGGGGAPGACADGALAALALQAGYGVLVGAGGPIPASPSTAGYRLAGSPRWILDVGAGWTTFRRPDLTDPQRTVRRSLQTAPRLTVAAGLFEGFAPAATVGGVGAVDLIGEFRLLPLPAMDGLSGRAASWGVGARIGLVRESFSLPGATVSVMHRRSGTLRYGDPVEDGVQARLRPRVTSVRAVVGKDLWEIGVSGGLQWDRIRGDGRLRVSEGSGAGAGDRTSGAVDLPVNRRTLFVAFNRTWVVTQLAAEFGWAPGAGSGDGLVGTGSFTEPGSALSGALTFRIRY